MKLFGEQTRTVVLLLLGIIGASPGSAADLVLEVDGLSHFSFEGSKVGAWLPAGMRIPAKIERTSATAWSIVIPAAAFAPPPVRYPSGREVEWRLSSAGRGTLERRATGIVCTIALPLVARAEGASQGVPFPLTFTTEQVSREAKGFVASREGVRFDPASGYLQLVAAGVSPESALTAPGEPFVAMVSARILDPPKDLFAP